MDLFTVKEWFAFAAMGGVGGFIYWSVRRLETVLEQAASRRRR
jgi:hypothetical protein